MRFDAVLFDVDGTLIHSAPSIYKTFTYTFEQLGIDPTALDLSRYLGPPLRWSFGQHFDDAATVERAVTIYRDYYATQGSKQCTLFPGVEEMLCTLRQAGVVLATATSKEKNVAAKILDEMGILHYFSLVGGASMDSSVDTKAAVIRQDLQDERLAGKRILMVGDRQDDMKGAAECHLPAAAVLYGYGSRKELEPWHPALIAADCPSLTNYILDNQRR